MWKTALNLVHPLPTTVLPASEYNKTIGPKTFFVFARCSTVCPILVMVKNPSILSWTRITTKI